MINGLLVLSLNEIKNRSGGSILGILHFDASGRLEWRCLVSGEYTGLELKREVRDKEWWVPKFALT